VEVGGDFAYVPRCTMSGLEIVHLDARWYGLWFGWPCMALHVGLALSDCHFGLLAVGRCLFGVPGRVWGFWCAVWFLSFLVLIIASGVAFAVGFVC
jgi:hypothetical protein